ncbi:MAG: hypothetical protein SGPRY_007182, partial [Prymnesium sp.]
PDCSLHLLRASMDALSCVWTHVRLERAAERLRASLEEEEQVALAHVERVSFPAPSGLDVNMMPFRMSDLSTLPPSVRDGYGPMVEICLATLSSEEIERVGYITVKESVVAAGETQRRAGMHTEGFIREANDFTSRCVREPFWHSWGAGRPITGGTFEGGIFMASSVSDSCHLWNVMIPRALVGRGGDVEHLRATIEEVLKPPAQPRVCEGHMGGPTGSATQDRDGKKARYPISMQANELFWISDQTPHESMPLRERQHRQFFRLVTSKIGVWYSAHSTPNPFGIQPQAPIVESNKFFVNQPERSR